MLRTTFHCQSAPEPAYWSNRLFSITKSAHSWGSLPVDQHGRVGSPEAMNTRLNANGTRKSALAVTVSPPSTTATLAITPVVSAGVATLTLGLDRAMSPVVSTASAENVYVAPGASLPTVTLRAEPGNRRIGLPFCRITMLSTAGFFLTSFWRSHVSTVLV